MTVDAKWTAKTRNNRLLLRGPDVNLKCSLWEEYFHKDIYVSGRDLHVGDFENNLCAYLSRAQVMHAKI